MSADPTRPDKHPALTQLVVCAGGTCGGPHLERVPKQAMLAAWKTGYLWRACHLSFGDCLGPCELKGNACVLQEGGFTWLAGLEPEDYPALTGWAAECKRARRALPLPPRLAARTIERFADPATLEFERKRP